MRSQEEMLAIILKKAKQEEHIRAALLQGSRVSKEAKPDCFQDYDVVFLVDAMEPFLSNPRWIDCFGRRIIMQIPEPPTRTRMTYLMQFADGNRIDLTLVSRDARDTDPRVCGMVLLDKDYIKNDVYPDMSKEYCNLDIVALNKLIIDDVFHIDEEKYEDYVHSTRSYESCYKNIQDGKYDIMFIMNPVRVEQIRNITAMGERLPEVTISVFPKPSVGVIINLKED